MSPATTRHGAKYLPGITKRYTITIRALMITRKLYHYLCPIPTLTKYSKLQSYYIRTIIARMMLLINVIVIEQ